MTQRIALINPDGTLDIGGVRCKVVRLVDIEFLPSHLRIDILKDAAAIDLSSLPVVPARRVSMDINGKNGWAQWNAALDAIGVKP